jgi:hypothetical protein
MSFGEVLVKSGHKLSAASRLRCHLNAHAHFLTIGPDVEASLQRPWESLAQGNYRHLPVPAKIIRPWGREVG